MRVLVTGATGFLGNNIVRALVENAQPLNTAPLKAAPLNNTAPSASQVTAVVRPTSDPRPLAELDVGVQSVDLLDASQVQRAVTESDVIIHSAGIIHIGRKCLEASRLANVETTRLLAQTARQHGVRMIYVSTVDTLPAATETTVCDETSTGPSKPASAYVISKREAEQVMLEEVTQGLDGVIVNPGFMVGPWDWKPSSGRMMLMLAKQPVLFFAPRGGPTVVDVRDVAAGIVAAIAKGRTGERYILGGENMTYLELWRLMAQVIDRRPPVRRMSNALACVVGRCGDLWGTITKNEPELNSVSVKMGQLYHWYCSDKAVTELGYRVGDVKNALQDGWDWFHQYGYV